MTPEKPATCEESTESEQSPGFLLDLDGNLPISESNLEEEEERELRPRIASHSLKRPPLFTDGETEAERWERLGQGHEAQTRPAVCLASSPYHISAYSEQLCTRTASLQ